MAVPIESSPQASRAGGEGQLAHNAVGLPQTLFQAVTFMAPGIGITLSLQPSLPFAGVALPLSALIGLALLATVAVSIGQLGKIYVHAGGLYEYISHATGARFGFIVGWINLLFQTFVAIVVYLQVAIIYQSVIGAKANYHLPFGWIIVFWALVVALTAVRGIKISTNVLLAAGVFEILLFIVLSIVLIIHGGGANTADAFNPSKAPQGVSGVFKGGLFVILAFIGFESAAVLGEESKEPRRIIPKAILLSTIAIGALYVLASYATVVGWGPGRLGTYNTASNPWLTMATTVWGTGWIIFFIALANSAYANCTAGINSSSRVYFAMGRARTLLPRLLGRTHRKYATPSLAIWVNTAIGLIGASITGAIWGPLTAFAVVATLFTLLVIGVYMAAAVACFYEYVVKRRPEMNPILHIVFPVVGFGALIATLYFLYNPLPPYPIRYALWVAPAWVVAGCILTWVLWQRDRRVVESSRDALAFDELEHTGGAGARPLFMGEGRDAAELGDQRRRQAAPVGRVEGGLGKVGVGANDRRVTPR